MLVYATPYLSPVYTTVNVFVATSFPAGTPGNFTIVFPLASVLIVPPASLTLVSSTVNPSGI